MKKKPNRRTDSQTLEIEPFRPNVGKEKETLGLLLVLGRKQEAEEMVKQKIKRQRETRPCFFTDDGEPDINVLKGVLRGSYLLSRPEYTGAYACHSEAGRCITWRSYERVINEGMPFSIKNPDLVYALSPKALGILALPAGDYLESRGLELCLSAEPCLPEGSTHPWIKPHVSGLPFLIWKGLDSWQALVAPYQSTAQSRTSLRRLYNLPPSITRDADGLHWVLGDDYMKTSFAECGRDLETAINLLWDIRIPSFVRLHKKVAEHVYDNLEKNEYFQTMVRQGKDTTK